MKFKEALEIVINHTHPLPRDVADVKNWTNERTKKIEQLRKDGKVNDMKRQIQDWKKKGYSTLPLEYKVKGLSGGEMKKILSDWKAKYKN